MTEVINNTIQQTSEQIINDFSLLGDWQNRYSYLIEIGRKLIVQSEHLKQDKYRFLGCQANVWLNTTIENDVIKFEGTSDSVIVAGLIALLLKVYSDRHPQDILDNPPDFIETIGLLDNLTSQRGTGLLRMLEKVNETAKQALSEQHTQSIGTR